MYIEKERLLKDIMALDFTLIDMNLYLDTHPYDQRALLIYNNVVQQAQFLRRMYERMYGPLLANASTSKCPWQWVESPWPWEKEEY